jgi:hypothetical protein
MGGHGVSVGRITAAVDGCCPGVAEDEGTGAIGPVVPVDDDTRHDLFKG